MKTLLIYALLLFMVFGFTSAVIAQRKVSPQKGVIKPSQVKSTGGRKISVDPCLFSSQQIDIDIEQLPPNYLGNNYQIIRDEVIKRGDFVKSEFETTAHFLERIEIEKNETLIGNLNYQTYFAFSDNDEASFKYDADKEVLTTAIAANSISFFRTACESQTQRTANSFYFDKDGLSFDYGFKKDFSMDVETVKILKPTLRTLYIVHLSNVIGSFFTRPSIWINSVQNYRTKLIKYETEIDYAQVQFNAAQRELNRSKDLLDHNVISRHEYDNSEKEYINARSTLEAKKLLLQSERSKLSLYISTSSSVASKNNPALNLEIKEIWIYDISSGKIWIKKKLTI